MQQQGHTLQDGPRRSDGVVPPEGKDTSRAELLADAWPLNHRPGGAAPRPTAPPKGSMGALRQPPPSRPWAPAPGALRRGRPALRRRGRLRLQAAPSPRRALLPAAARSRSTSGDRRLLSPSRATQGARQASLWGVAAAAVRRGLSLVGGRTRGRACNSRRQGSPSAPSR